MKIRYFAWVRERVGRGEEDIAFPEHVTTVADVVAFLKTQGPEYETAFENEKIVRAALDRVHVKPDTALADAREIAFFPPMTGG